VASLRTSSARLFVAMDLPAEARDALVRWRAEALAGRDELRPVAAEALHVTLVFLGHLPEERIEEIAALVEDAVPDVEAPLLTALGVKPVPPRRPRLFALDLADEGGRAGAVQQSVSDALEAAGLYEPEKRPFWPHVTLARVRKGQRAEALPGPEPPADPWRAEAVTLYRSRLSSKGARYEPLSRTQFG
jgi:RNA 2',3'-cyclic 3'-phosphodiesterase